MSEDLRFPVGEFDAEEYLNNTDRQERIATIRDLPARLTEAVEGLSDAQLDSEYRPEGWSIRQVVHHLADSHINSFCRFKLALTEDKPTVRTYDEQKWAELPDSDESIDDSMAILNGLHARWAGLLDSMDDVDFEKELVHPDSGVLDLETMLALYHWHSLHHTAHITSHRERMGW